MNWWNYHSSRSQASHSDSYSFNTFFNSFLKLQNIMWFKVFMKNTGLYTAPTVTAVDCAATFVPFFVFLKPSIPHDLNSSTTPKIWKLIHQFCSYPLWLPLEFVKVIIVLFGDTFMLKIGKSLKGIPLNNLFGVSIFGNVSFLL